ncbi:YheC/YheD family protein [Cohnella caldifontis]|uniref:YheC/YheD family protein n=1 Tax=Cohnella caldifontis TaxID=3027471 RepID=UPI0023EA9E0E|nr:YheC/YheD family protein [Cohnella sp. YIM B05605]
MGKWFFHRFYSKHPVIRRHLPPTSVFRAATLNQYLRRYGAVYIKPDRTHQGKGVIKAWKTGKGYAWVLLRGAPKKCRTSGQLYRAIKKRALPQEHIVQKAIRLARIRGRPLDIRVMMMRNTRNRWQFFGLYSKVAGPTSIVTNISNSRGYVLPFEKSMKQSLGLSRTEANLVKARMVRLSHAICRHAGKIRRYHKVGIDFAVDARKKIWMIEANFTYPGYKGFSRLPDKTAYWRIKKMDNILRSRLR